MRATTTSYSAGLPGPEQRERTVAAETASGTVRARPCHQQSPPPGFVSPRPGDRSLPGLARVAPGQAGPAQRVGHGAARLPAVPAAISSAALPRPVPARPAAATRPPLPAAALSAVALSAAALSAVPLAPLALAAGPRPALAR